MQQSPGASPGKPSREGLPVAAEVAASVSDRVAAAATAAAAAAAVAAAARAEATAAVARRYLQPWVLVEEYSKWRHEDQQELRVWEPRGSRIFREHLLPYVPADVSPAVAAAQAAAAAEAGAPSSSSSSSTPGSSNRFAAFFGGSAASAAALAQHPWAAAQVKELLREEIWGGVPDAYKSCVWLHSNGSLQQQLLQPGLYRQLQQQAFGGPPFPGTDPGRCPTFSGGLLGLEEDVCAQICTHCY
ncbi:hypothetical protein ETH_00025500 [Eimeria tenella]|uniref:Uncharacterized protein n=1 Tax=Eimeria tenella TaxID=5802 RepID=U6KIW0_EIMTE|nr:hypothetical protein ETH_00025500 [Eimeria tenella]CDJ37839.1 hypothetical protein ETH_00025500 [Eimeria tenella]|eukprot:XP_013228677.1 hypothetical protein ETH_00025500 [Eimeria tenella]